MTEKSPAIHSHIHTATQGHIRGLWHRLAHRHIRKAHDQSHNNGPPHTIRKNTQQPHNDNHMHTTIQTRRQPHSTVRTVTRPLKGGRSNTTTTVTIRVIPTATITQRQPRETQSHSHHTDTQRQPPSHRQPHRRPVPTHPSPSWVPKPQLAASPPPPRDGPAGDPTLTNRTPSRQTQRGPEAGEKRYRRRPEALPLTGSTLPPPEPWLHLDGPGAAGRTDKPTASQRANAEMETRSAGPAAPRSLRAGGRGGASGTLFA